jgi:hypothetical protein
LNDRKIKHPALISGQNLPVTKSSGPPNIRPDEAQLLFSSPQEGQTPCEIEQGEDKLTEKVDDRKINHQAWISGKNLSVHRVPRSATVKADIT